MATSWCKPSQGRDDARWMARRKACRWAAAIRLGLVGWLTLTRLHRPVGIDTEQRSKRAWLPAVAFAVALAGGDLAFVAATRRIPAAQANLLCYLWPVMIVLFGAAIGLFRLRARQI